MNNKGIGTFALVMLMTGAIDSVRNLPATALFGSALIFFFIFSAIVFLIPAALVSAELSARFTEKNGIFHWLHEAFGKRMAFFGIWLQWINTLVWFPTILSFIAGTLIYFIAPNLAQNKFYLTATILGMFWFLTIINLKGIHFSSRFSSLCAIVGMIIPLCLIIVLAIIWVAMGHPLQIHFDHAALFPTLTKMDNWMSLTAIMTAFLGMELATVHIHSVRHPQKTFPRALGLSTLIILTTMILGSLAIAMVLPKNQINLVNGVMQAFTHFFENYHLAWIIPIMTVMLIMGSTGGIISWVISPIKGLLQAAESGFLPPLFTKENKHGVPGPLLLLQALIVSVICMVFLFLPSVNSSYWLLTALSTQLYIVMYVLMFAAFLVIKWKSDHTQKNGFTIPGKKPGMILVCLLGLIGCFITLVAGFIPPSIINFNGLRDYEMGFVGGILLMVMPVVFFYWYEAKKSINLQRSP